MGIHPYSPKLKPRSLILDQDNESLYYFLLNKPYMVYLEITSCHQARRGLILSLLAFSCGLFFFCILFSRSTLHTGIFGFIMIQFNRGFSSAKHNLGLLLI